MLQIAFVLVLAVLWALTLTQPGGSDFVRIRVFQSGVTVIRVLDVLICMAILALLVTMRGPLRIMSAALLVLWALTLVGVPQVMGVSISPLIVLIIIMGATVHIVTHRSH
jgi:hypothetical protein